MELNFNFVGRLLILLLVLGLVFFYTPEFVDSSSKLEKTSTDYWEVFEKITKERKYIEEVSTHYNIPVFTPELQELSGEEILIRGYYLPYSILDSVIIISRYPIASCFYCGAAGVESVAMVELSENTPKFKTDQILNVRGRLSLNDSDINKLAFVLEEAAVE